MTKEEIYQDLNEIFKEILELDEVNLTDSTTADEVEGWDSLAHISLISEVERHFRVKLTMKEIVNLHNVGEMVELIQAKLG